MAAEHERRLADYEGQVAQLQETIKGLEEEVVVLRRRLQDAPLLKSRTVVDAFRDPDAPALVNIHVGRVAQHRFGREERSLETLGHSELFRRFIRGLGIGYGRGFLRERIARQTEKHCRQ